MTSRHRPEPAGPEAMNEAALRTMAGGLLLAVSLVLSVYLLPAPGTLDVGVFLSWMEVVREEGLFAGYASVVANFPRGLIEGLGNVGGGEYPPLAYAILYAAGTFGDFAGLTPFQSFKLALLVSHWAAVILVLVISRDFLVATAFSAAILLSGVALGYMDVCLAPWLIAAFWMVRSGYPLVGLGLFMVSVLVKWQPLIILPFLMIHLLGISDMRSARAALGGRLFRRMLGLAAVAALLLGAAFGSSPAMAFLYATGHPFLSGNALNLPRLADFVLQSLADPSFNLGSEVAVSTPPAMVLLPFKALFWAGFVVVLYLAVRSGKTLRNCLLFSTLGFVTYCTLNTGVHENHWFVAFVLAFVLAIHDPSPASRMIAILLAVMLNVNLFLFYGVTGDPVLPVVLGIDLSIPLAILYCAVWLLLLHYAWRAAERAPRVRGGEMPVRMAPGHSGRHG